MRCDRPEVPRYWLQIVSGHHAQCHAIALDAIGAQSTSGEMVLARSTASSDSVTLLDVESTVASLVGQVIGQVRIFAVHQFLC